MKQHNGFSTIITSSIVAGLALVIAGAVFYTYYSPKEQPEETLKDPNVSTETPTITPAPSPTPPTHPLQPSAPSPVSTGVRQCGPDANCFIQAATTCSNATARVTVKQPLDLAFINLTEKLNINGIKSGNCLFTSYRENVVVELNQEAFQEFKTQAEAWLAQGQISQQAYEDGLKEAQDISDTQAFWNTQIGVSNDCVIPTDELVTILKGWILPQPGSETTTIVSASALIQYCELSAPNLP